MDTVEEPLKARQISYSKWIDSAVYHSSPESLVSMESAELVSPGSAQKKLNSVSLRLGSSWRNTLNKTCGSLLCYFHQFKESTEHCHNSQQLTFNKLKTLPLMCMYNMYMFPRNNAPEQSAWWSQSEVQTSLWPGLKHTVWWTLRIRVWDEGVSTALSTHQWSLKTNVPHPQRCSP